MSLKYLKHATIEPVFFFYYATFLVLDSVNTNLYLQKSCRFNATAEPDLDTRCDDEKQGVLFASKVNSDYRYLMFTVCILYTVLATCWSDQAGRRRRPLIFLPIIGQILQSASGCLHSYFWSWKPMAAVFSDMFFETSVGGVTLMIVAAQIYLCDISSTPNRTMRLGLLWGVKTLCMPVGNGSAGYLIRSFGFLGTYSLCLLSSAAALVLALLLVKDVSVPVEKAGDFCALFDVTRIVDSFKVVFKKSLGSKRIAVLLLAVLYVSMYFTIQGEKTVFYLFLRYRFGWNERQYSLYLVYRNAGVIIGTIFCSVVLSKYLQIHDGLIGAFASFWDTLAVIGYLYANQNWHLYVVPIFDVFHGTAMSVGVSFLSKYYESNEFGRVNAVLNVFSLVIPLCHPAYNIVFQNTIDFFPSAFFIISIVVNTVVFVLYSTLYLLCRKEKL